MSKATDNIIYRIQNLSVDEKKEIYAHLKDEFDTPKKRGRKSTKIRDAYDAITYEPQDYEKLKAKYDVSDGVLKQHKRFDSFPERGKVKTLDVAGTRMIWRDESTKEPIRFYATVEAEEKSVIEQFCADINKQVKDRTFKETSNVNNLSERISGVEGEWSVLLSLDPAAEEDIDYLIKQSEGGQLSFIVIKYENRKGGEVMIDLHIEKGKIKGKGEWINAQEEKLLEDDDE